MLSTQLLRTPLSRRFLPLLLAFGCATLAARAETLYLLTSGGALLTTTTAAPSSTGTPLQITGVTGGETLVAIDVRPQNQKLYALGVNATANTATLYHLAPETGVAAPVGTASSIALVNASLTPIDFPDPSAVAWDIDFNPAADRLRVVAGSLNFRINPNTGAAVDGDTSSVGVINPDGSINGGTTTVGATAYTNNRPNNGGLATQYTLDTASDSLFIQNPPNNGTQTQGVAVTLSGNALNFSRASMDIAPGVNTTVSNSPVSAGSAFVVGTVGGTTGLYSLNLVTAAANFLGNVPSQQTVLGLAVRPELDAAVVLSSGGAALQRFSPTSPTTVTTQVISGLGGSEVLAGIAARPQTGQLYGLGVNAAANTASLYVLDPQTGALTLVGGAGGISFVDTIGAAVDLPDPALVGYGLDFNPTVDRVRVVTGTGLNFRVNPNTGAPVDGNLGGAAVSGTTPDGPINGSGVTGVEAVAYTNSFGQPLTGGTTTQYTLSSVSNRLHVQNPSNAGTQTLPVAITKDGAPLNFGVHTGFDIPTDVGTTLSSEGWMVATVEGITGIYRFDLLSGVAYSPGSLGAGQTPASSLVVFATLPKFSLTSDLAPVVAGVPTRINPLANDDLDGSAVITGVSAPGVVIEGRTLIIPAGFNAPFTYTVSAANLGSYLATDTVTPTQAAPATTAKTFNGLLLDENGDIIGWANATIATSGLTTLQIRGGTASISAKLVVPADGTAATVLTSLGNLTVTRQQNGTVSLSLAALGGPVSGSLRAARATTAATTHHIALASVDAAVPGGGYAIAKTNAKAAVSVKGTLPDGLVFTASTTLRDNGSLAFYTAVTKGAKPPAVLGGELVAANLAATDITGELVYLKLPQVAGTKGLHLQGVDTVLAANGSLYTPAGPGLDSAGTLTLSGGNLAQEQVLAVTVSTRGVPNLSTLLPKWTAAAAKTGTFTASLRLPGATKNVTASGVYLPKSKTAWGYFPGTTEGGRIELTTP